MPSQEQGELELKHIGILRKAFASMQPMMIEFEGPGWSGKVHVANGAVERGEESVTTLRNALSRPVTRFTWNAAGPLASPEPARSLFQHAITDMKIDSQRLLAYKDGLSRLPAVQVRAGTLFRFGLDEVKEFQTLYQMSLRGGVNIAEYLQLVTDFTVLHRRITVVLITYCLGDLLPATPRKSTDQRQVMASKILARLRRDA